MDDWIGVLIVLVAAIPPLFIWQKPDNDTPVEQTQDKPAKDEKQNLPPFQTALKHVSKTYPSATPENRLVRTLRVLLHGPNIKNNGESVLLDPVDQTRVYVLPLPEGISMLVGAENTKDLHLAVVRHDFRTNTSDEETFRAIPLKQE